MFICQQQTYFEKSDIDYLAKKHMSVPMYHSSKEAVLSLDNFLFVWRTTKREP